MYQWWTLWIIVSFDWSIFLRQNHSYYDKLDKLRETISKCFSGVMDENLTVEILVFGETCFLENTYDDIERLYHNVPIIRI